jgi:hypothetical protein
MTAKERREKIRTVMREFEAGTLKSSSGEPVKSRQQAIAIALSEAGMSRKSNSDEYWDGYFEAMLGKS